MTTAPNSRTVNFQTRTLLAVASVLTLGLLDVLFLLWTGLPLVWGFVILPPILMVTGLAWIFFSHVDEAVEARS